MARNWKDFPELRNNELAMLYFESPHKQIFEDFDCKVVKVHDGDTITVRAEFRDFDFPIRMIGIDAIELKDEGGKEAQEWLEDQLLDEDIRILIDPRQRIGKWGRLLGIVTHMGLNINELSMNVGNAVPFNERHRGQTPDLDKMLNLKQWL